MTRDEVMIDLQAYRPEFFRRYSGRWGSFTRDELEDLYSTTLVRVAVAADAQEIRELHGFFYRAFTRQLFNAADRAERRLTRSADQMVEEDGGEPRRLGATREDDVESKVLADHIRLVLADLASEIENPLDQKVLFLTVQAQLKPREIAATLSLPITEVRPSCDRINKRLDTWRPLFIDERRICERRRGDVDQWLVTGVPPKRLRRHLRWCTSCQQAMLTTDRGIAAAFFPVAPVGLAGLGAGGGLLGHAYLRAGSSQTVQKAHDMVVNVRKWGPWAGGGAVASGKVMAVTAVVGTLAVAGTGAAVSELTGGGGHHHHHRSHDALAVSPRNTATASQTTVASAGTVTSPSSTTASHPVTTTPAVETTTTAKSTAPTATTASSAPVNTVAPTGESGVDPMADTASSSSSGDSVHEDSASSKSANSSSGGSKRSSVNPTGGGGVTP